MTGKSQKDPRFRKSTKWIFKFALVTGVIFTAVYELNPGAAMLGARRAQPRTAETAIRATVRAGEHNQSQRVTFDRSVAPILYKYCATCHRPVHQARSIYSLMKTRGIMAIKSLP